MQTIQMQPTLIQIRHVWAACSTTDYIDLNTNIDIKWRPSTQVAEIAQMGEL